MHHIKQLQYRKGKGRATTASAEVMEFGFKAVRRIKTKTGVLNDFIKHGYIVSIAAVVLPSGGRTFWGASVCSPEDIFNAKRGADQSLGRARQNCVRFLRGSNVSSGFTADVISTFAGGGGFDPSQHSMEQLRISPDFENAIVAAVKGARAARVRKAVLSLGLPLEEIAAMIATEVVSESFR